MKPPTPPIKRWFKYVDITDTCWIWTGAKQANGYGRFGLGGRDGRRVLVHRWAYEQFVGPIPEGLTIDHLCRNTACVNVQHMEVVTREENAYRGNRNKDKTHCDHGHELTPENVYVPPNRPTVRDCIACRKERRIAYAARQRAA